LLVAGAVTTGIIATGHHPRLSFTLRGASTPMHAQAAALPPVLVPTSFDHFDFSYYWLAFHPQPAISIHGQAAFLVDMDTRMVMWARDPETMRAPASLTKVITAMVAVDDAGSLDRMIEVTPLATQVVPSHMGLSPGERLTLRDVLYGLFLVSGNDAAEALASGIVPRDRFIRQMNQKAKSIGLTNSHFVDPSGLDANGHGMSAHDLVHAAAYLDRYYPQVAAIAGTRDMTIRATALHKTFYLQTINRLLFTYPGATGLKTGFTDNAGGCMLATATRGGRHLIVVVLNATGYSTADATRLLDYGFSVRTQSFGPFTPPSAT
jgi:D-alanyl-D-alanine carboxypeptidase (penicillin-binding protein 5/6)